MLLLQSLLALACLGQLASSLPHAQDAGRQEIKPIRQAVTVDGVRQAQPGIGRPQMTLQKRNYNEVKKQLRHMYKETLKKLWTARGMPLPSECVLQCLTRRSVDAALLDAVPHEDHLYLALIDRWSVDCKKECGEDDGRPGPTSPTTETEKPIRAKPKGFGNPNLNFRLHPMRAAKAVTHRLGALVGGWQRSAAGLEKSAGRLVRGAEAEMSFR
ncbi:MAG: hypothetical protein M1826_005863 [Phylliscum demangeonii]|nr:MAG: hypothetical protein M1826_005863 [Phylliscum demangeonii]